MPNPESKLLVEGILDKLFFTFVLQKAFDINEKKALEYIEATKGSSDLYNQLAANCLPGCPQIVNNKLVKSHKKGNKLTNSTQGKKILGWSDTDKGKNKTEKLLTYIETNQLWCIERKLEARTAQVCPHKLLGSFYSGNNVAWRIEEWLIKRAKESGINRSFLNSTKALKEHPDTNELKSFFNDLYNKNNKIVLNLINKVSNFL